MIEKKLPLWVTLTGLYALLWLIVAPFVVYGMLGYYHHWAWFTWLFFTLTMDLLRHRWLTNNSYKLDPAAYRQEPDSQN